MSRRIPLVLQLTWSKVSSEPLGSKLGAEIVAQHSAIRSDASLAIPAPVVPFRNHECVQRRFPNRACTT